MTKRIIAEAKKIREQAAKKWDCTAREIDWQACVGMAIKGEILEEKTKTIEEIINENKNVAYTSRWNTRLYINLKITDRTFRGESTHQLYYCTLTNKIIEKRGKGTTRGIFDEMVEKVIEELS